MAGVSISAETATTYSATGTSAINSITGSVTVAIEGGTVTAGDGGVTLSAQDNSELTAQAGGIPIALDTLGALDEVDRLGAVNQLNRDVQAYSNAANIQTSGAGNVSLEAVRNARIQATTQAMELTGTLDPELRLNVDIALGGTVAVNTVLGDVSAYIQGGSVWSAGTGDISLNAQDTSLVHAKSEISAIAQSGVITLIGTGSAGVSLAFNAMGWSDPGLHTLSLDALIGIQLGTEESVNVQAYILDSTVNSGGNLSVTALSDAQINATVT